MGRPSSSRRSRTGSGRDHGVGLQGPRPSGPTTTGSTTGRGRGRPGSGRAGRVGSRDNPVGLDSGRTRGVRVGLPPPGDRAALATGFFRSMGLGPGCGEGGHCRDADRNQRGSHGVCLLRPQAGSAGHGISGVSGPPGRGVEARPPKCFLLHPLSVAAGDRGDGLRPLEANPARHPVKASRRAPYGRWRTDEPGDGRGRLQPAARTVGTSSPRPITMQLTRYRPPRRAAAATGSSPRGGPGPRPSRRRARPPRLPAEAARSTSPPGRGGAPGRVPPVAADPVELAGQRGDDQPEHEERAAGLWWPMPVEVVAQPLQRRPGLAGVEWRSPPGCNGRGPWRRRGETPRCVGNHSAYFRSNSERGCAKPGAA